MSFKIIASAIVLLSVGLSGNLQAGASDQSGELSGVSEAQGMLIAEGDIFVGHANDPARLAARGLGLSAKLSLWPGGLIPYQFSSGLSEQVVVSLQAAIDHWNDNSSITLINRAEASADSADYIEFTAGPGCASWVGRRGGMQEIWVSEFCTTGSMIHEIGHAIGLLHEHTRADRDQFITVLWDNIHSDKSFNFEISGSGTTDLGSYDYGSIMHYGEYFFSETGEPTIVPVNATDQVIGQRIAASAGDLAAVDTLYATDLSLDADIIVDDVESRVELRVANLTDTGAHDISVRLASADQVSSFSSADPWTCTVDNAGIDCTLGLLQGTASSTVTVYFDGTVTAEELLPQLDSKTHDTNSANNQSALTLAAALRETGAADDSDGLESGGSGGGSFGWLMLFALLIPANVRRRGNCNVA